MHIKLKKLEVVDQGSIEGLDIEISDKAYLTIIDLVSNRFLNEERNEKIEATLSRLYDLVSDATENDTKEKVS